MNHTTKPLTTVPSRITLTLSLLALGLTASACGDDSKADDATSETAGSGGDFEFASDDAAAFARVDRLGMPAVGTAVIASKDDYNAASPSDDANGDFVAEITTSVEGLHAALDDDLTGLGLTPCAAADCIAQAAPLVVPDTLKVDLEAASGFPNGRRLEDPVIDVTLAVLLLDLTVTGQDALALVGVNPTQNDKAFGAAFPFLATPHVP